MPSFLLKIRDGLVINLLNVTCVRNRDDRDTGHGYTGEVIVGFNNGGAIGLDRSEGDRLFRYLNANADTLPTADETPAPAAGDEDSERFLGRFTT